jgi:hypothetical protein
MREWFKPISGYEDLYEISNLGRIRTLDPRFSGRLMKFSVDQQGEYLVVRLTKFGVRTKFAVHRLVFEHFNSHLETGDIVHHIDENKRNNASNNLMKTTDAEHKKLHSIGVKPIYVTF